MNLKKKKNLASKTLGIGKKRIVFVKQRLGEIKEAITKQDIKDLKKEGAIVIKETKGRSKVNKKSKKRGPGKIKKKVNKRKQKYVIMTRKLRKYSAELKKQGKLSGEEVKEIRKKIRNKKFKSKAHLREQIKTRKE
ncbi:MAG: 50S ribosomal protein L19e [archaeon]